MKRIVAVAALALAVAGCAATSVITERLTGTAPSPEAQIVTGANSVRAAATLGDTLLKTKKITAAQARSYITLLNTANAHLNVANDALLACRKATSSSATTRPDPCAPTVASDIALGISVVSEVQKALSAK